MSNNIKFSLTAIEAKDLFASDSNGFSDPYFKIPHHQNGVVDLPGKKNRTKVVKKNLTQFGIIHLTLNLIHKYAINWI